MSALPNAMADCQRLDAHQGPVNVVRYNHGAKYVLTGSADRSIRLWNANAGKQIKIYQGHAHEVLALDMYAQVVPKAVEES